MPVYITDHTLAYYSDHLIPMASLNTTTTIDRSPVTTTFVYDGPIAETVYNNSAPGTVLFGDQALKDFMAKPRLVDTITWSTSDVSLTNKGTYSPSSLLSSVSEWANKIEGFGMVRGTAVLTVMINATPFQQGKLIATFLPACASYSYPTRMRSRVSVTQLPNVEIDCRDTAGSLTIPYVSSAEWWTPHAVVASYAWGSFSLDVMSPLLVGASADTEVTVSVYMHFTNFELAAPICPQSGGNPRMKSGKFKNMAEIESIACQGSISRGLSVGASVATALSAVPSLAPLTAPAAWAMNTLAGTASAFGYAKPGLDKPTEPIVNMPEAYLQNADGPFAGKNMGLIHGNSVGLRTDCSIRDGDEMSFNFLKKVECWFGDIPWAVNDAPGDPLLTHLIDPRNFYEQVAVTHGAKSLTGTYRHPVGYITNDFGTYRGSVRLKFKFIKTQFHTGRLQFTFTPTIATTLPDLETSMLSLREIVDISASDEVIFTIPYLRATPYIDIIDHLGTLEILVLNELRAPATVSQTFTIQAYVSYGDDFEFAVPVPRVGYQMAMSLESGTEDIIVDENIGQQAIAPAGLNNAEACIGERFNSLRQLLARFSPITLRVATTSTAGYYIWPWFVNYRYLLVNGSAFQCHQNLGNDYFDKCAPMYAFQRGSMRVAVSGGTPGVAYLIPTDGTTYTFGQNWLSPVWTTPLDFNVAANTSGTKAGAMGETLSHTSNGASTLMVAEVPFYCATRCAPIYYGKLSDPTYRPPGIDQPRMALATNSPSWVNVARAIGEDFQFSYFLSAPPVWEAET